MTSRNWAEGSAGNTPLRASWLNGIERDLDIRVQLYQANTAYLSGQVVIGADAIPYMARETFTSSGSWDPSKWTPAAFLTQAAADGRYLPMSASILQSLRGSYAARPAASSVPNGSLYFAENVWEMYRSDGTSWQVQGNGGNELGHAQLVAQPLVTNATTTWAGINGMSLAFTAGERPVMFSFASIVANAAGQTTTVGLFLDAATTPMREIPRTLSLTDVWDGLDGEWKSQPGMLTPGQTYTVSLKFKSSSTSAARYGGDGHLRVMNL